jgi:hemolysin activation/secretion protein
MRWTGRIAGNGAVLALVAGLPGVVQAQNVPAQGVPIGTPTREQLQRPLPVPAPTQERVRIRDEVERAPCPLDNPAYADIRFRLTRVAFADLGPVAEVEIADSYRPYMDTEQPISIVCRIRDAAATRLRELGYIAAVEVPVQRIVGGEVRFQVLYGRVTAVRVIGDVGANQHLLESYVSRLADGQLFNRRRAERLLLLARDIPGYDIQLTLKPAGSGAGNLIAELRVGRTPLIVDFSGSNLAAPSTGRYGGQVRATLNGLLGLGDQTTLSAYSTAEFREQQIYQIGEEMRLGSQGLRLGGHLTYARTRLDLDPAIPPVRARTFLANAEIGYPLIRRQGGNVRLNGGMDILNQSVDFAGVPLSRDRLRIAYLRLDLDALDLAGHGPGESIGWRAQGSIELRRGLSIFGASPNCATDPARCAIAGFVPPSISVANPEATVLRATAAIEWHPLQPLIVAISPRVQVASAPLAAYEQMSLGNFTIGRGFFPGTLTGDDGAGAQIELRKTPIRLLRSGSMELQPYLFADNGWVWRHSSGLGGQRLSTVGGGSRFDMGRLGRLDTSIAIPVSTVPGEAKRRKPLFLLTYSAILFPFRSQ